MEYSLYAVPRRCRTAVLHRLERLDHMTVVCMRKSKVCWMCSKEKRNKVVESGERLQGAKCGKTGTVDV